MQRPDPRSDYARVGDSPGSARRRGEASEGDDEAAVRTRLVDGWRTEVVVRTQLQPGARSQAQAQLLDARRGYDRGPAGLPLPGESLQRGDGFSRTRPRYGRGGAGRAYFRFRPAEVQVSDAARCGERSDAGAAMRSRRRTRQHLCDRFASWQDFRVRR